MALLQIHYIPPSLGEPINSAYKSESTLLAEIAKVVVSLLVDECDLRVSENGSDLAIKLHIELDRKPRVEPVVVETL